MHMNIDIIDFIDILFSFRLDMLSSRVILQVTVVFWHASSILVKGKQTSVANSKKIP